MKCLHDDNGYQLWELDNGWFEFRYPVGHYAGVERKSRAGLADWLFSEWVATTPSNWPWTSTVGFVWNYLSPEEIVLAKLRSL